MHLTKEKGGKKGDRDGEMGGRGKWREIVRDPGGTLARSGLLENIRLVPKVHKGDDTGRTL